MNGMNTNRSEQNHKYYMAHREKFKEYKNKWCREHPDEVKEYQRQYREHNRRAIRQSKLNDPPVIVDETILDYIRSEGRRRIQTKQRELFSRLPLWSAVREFNNLLAAIGLSQIANDM